MDRPEQIKQQFLTDKKIEDCQTELAIIRRKGFSGKTDEELAEFAEGIDQMIMLPMIQFQEIDSLDNFGPRGIEEYLSQLALMGLASENLVDCIKVGELQMVISMACFGLSCYLKGLVQQEQRDRIKEETETE